MVTATDGAVDKRLGTASVTVQVQDVADEPPMFQTPLYAVHVPENVPNYPVVKVKVSISVYLNKFRYVIQLPINYDQMRPNDNYFSKILNII